jgi:hypothetical protein
MIIFVNFREIKVWFLKQKIKDKWFVSTEASVSAVSMIKILDLNSTILGEIKFSYEYISDTGKARTGNFSESKEWFDERYTMMRPGEELNKLMMAYNIIKDKEKINKDKKISELVDKVINSSQDIRQEIEKKVAEAVEKAKVQTGAVEENSHKNSRLNFLEKISKGN